MNFYLLKSNKIYLRSYYFFLSFLVYFAVKASADENQLIRFQDVICAGDTGLQSWFPSENQLIRLQTVTRVGDIALEGDSVLWAAVIANYPYNLKGPYRSYGGLSNIIVKFDLNTAYYQMLSESLGNILLLSPEIELLLGIHDKILKYQDSVWIDISTEIELVDDYIAFMDFDSKDRLWCATNINTLFMFDGANWTDFPYSSLLKYPEEYQSGEKIRGLTIDKDDNIWLSALGTLGLVRFDGKEWVIPEWDWQLTDSIPGWQHFTADSEGNIWWGGFDGLVRKHDGNSVTIYDLGGFKLIYSIGAGPDNRILVGAVGELFEIFDDVVRKVQVDGLSSNPSGWANTIIKAIPASNDQICIGTKGQGIFYFNGEKWSNYSLFDGISTGKIMAGVTGQNNYCWLATYDGLNAIGWKIYNFYQYPPELWKRQIASMALDSDNEKWLVTEDGDIWIFNNDSTWTDYPNAEFLKGKRVSSMVIDSLDAVLVGTVGDGIFKFNNVSWQQITTDDGLASNNISCLVLDRIGRLWCGTTDNGVCYFNGDHWTVMNSTNGLADDSVTAIAFDAWGDTWIGTRSGLSQFNGSRWTSFTTADGLPDNEITALFADEHTYINLGTRKGLTIYDGINWKTYGIEGSEEGNRITAILRSDFFKFRIFETGEILTGHVWVGTLNGYYWAPCFPLHPVPVESEEFGSKRNKLPKSFSLSQNFPNPFNPSTSISFNVTDGIKAPHTTLKIYDLRGRLLRTLIDKPLAPGSYTVSWKGKNEKGQKVSSGAYFYRLTSAGFSQTRKMVLIK